MFTQNFLDSSDKKASSKQEKNTQSFSLKYFLPITNSQTVEYQSIDMIQTDPQQNIIITMHAATIETKCTTCLCFGKVVQGRKLQP